MPLWTSIPKFPLGAPEVTTRLRRSSPAPSEQKMPDPAFAKRSTRLNSPRTPWKKIAPAGSAQFLTTVRSRTHELTVAMSPRLSDVSSGSHASATTRVKNTALHWDSVRTPPPSMPVHASSRLFLNSSTRYDDRPQTPLIQHASTKSVRVGLKESTDP